MFILKLVVDTKSAPRLEGKRKQKKNGDKAVRFPSILYQGLSFLLRYTTSLSTLILQDFCKI
jgi:hypothetical protein